MATTKAKPKANSDMGFTLGLVLGTLVGAGLGTLLAPCTGADTRGQLAFQSERLKRRLRELKESLQDAEPNLN